MIEQLRDIPWLELDIDIDLEKLSKEYQILLNNYTFEDYKTIFWQVRRKYKKAWSGISLISSDGSLYSDLYEGNTNGDNFQKTKLKDLVPYMYEVIEKINGGLSNTRCRVMRIAPKQSLVWHSHILEHGQLENELTIQIPIVMPSEFEYCVVHKDEFRWWKRFYKPNWFKKIWRGRLEVGKAYYFNSYHYHNVYNYSNEYRATIMLYIDLKNEYVYNLVNRSLNKK
jgi:hypothetical protein